MRECEYNGHTVEEVVWRGKIIVYVDGSVYNGAFEDALSDLQCDSL